MHRFNVDHIIHLPQKMLSFLLTEKSGSIILIFFIVTSPQPQFNNFITKRMGAGCMGPNRRSTNYQVNRLT